jgi:hypothetical protein
MSHTASDKDKVVARLNAGAADRAANPAPRREGQRGCQLGEHCVTPKSGIAESLRNRCPACQHSDKRQATTSATS